MPSQHLDVPATGISMVKDDLGKKHFPAELKGKNHVKPELGESSQNRGGQKFPARSLKTSCCIFKIPKYLTYDEYNYNGYQPTIVSIGPYHYGEQQLQNIEKHKERFQDFFFFKSAKSKEHLVDTMTEQVKKIRDSYSEDLVGFPDKELIEMMILDGCFLLTMFLKTRILDGNIFAEFKDPIFDLPWVMPSIRRDLLLVENQIPYFILQTLLETAEFQENLNNIALTFFSNSFRQPMVANDREEAKHLLDLIRLTFTPTPAETTISCSESYTAPAPDDFLKVILSAKKLQSSGIRFKPKKSSMILDITLEKGKLKIPEIALDDFIGLVLLNCIAFEQFCENSKNYITSYVMFMGCLINNESDAAFLEEEGIIQNYYGTEDEMSRFFKRICRDYAFNIENSYLAPVFVGVNRYTANACNVQWSVFKRIYFGSIWIFLSTIAALALLVLTLLQVLYAAGVLLPASHGKGNGN